MIKSIVALSFLSLAVAFSSHAQDTDRIAQLEKEVQELRARVSKLESLLSSQGNTQGFVASGDGWKSVANWRRLVTDMNPSDVRRILGEPERIDGGNVARWYYSNGGRVAFISEKVTSWTEPRN
jgi:outer membrane protein assembly factor BamE (lipoprotein component of BamABCDE complex)